MGAPEYGDRWSPGCSGEGCERQLLQALEEGLASPWTRQRFTLSSGVPFVGLLTTLLKASDKYPSEGPKTLLSVDVAACCRDLDQSLVEREGPESLTNPLP